MGPRDRAKAADRAATARPTCCTRRACSHSPSRASSEVGSGGDAAASASTSLVAVAMRSLYASDDVGLYDCPRSRLAASESSESLSSVLTLALTNAGAKVAVIAGAARAGVGAARRERPTAATLVSANMFACSSSHEAPGERETQHWGKNSISGYGPARLRAPSRSAPASVGGGGTLLDASCCALPRTSAPVAALAGQRARPRAAWPR